MANRIFVAAMKGELNPDKLWQIAVRGLNPPAGKDTPAA